MIIKKPWRHVIVHENKKDKTLSYMSITDYMGYWLFGLIPIYLKVLDKYNYFYQSGTRLEHSIIREEIITKYLPYKGVNI